MPRPTKNLHACALSAETIEDLAMKKCIVKEMMVPLSEYATVSESDSLADAVIALEESQKHFDPSRYRHRAILVLDDQGRVSGKIDQIDLLKALEPKYDTLQNRTGMAHLVFTKKFMESMLTSYSLWEKPMEEICSKGANRRLKDFMHVPAESEYIEEDASLDVAIHLLISQRFQSLLVTREGEVVGILRLTDVFTEVVDAVKACRLQHGCGKDRFLRSYLTSLGGGDGRGHRGGIAASALRLHCIQFRGFDIFEIALSFGCQNASHRRNETGKRRLLAASAARIRKIEKEGISQGPGQLQLHASFQPAAVADVLQRFPRKLGIPPGRKFRCLQGF